jgi:hypothetical protein
MKILQQGGDGTKQYAAISQRYEEVVDLNSMKTKTLDDGSEWARIHWLDVNTNAASTGYFASATEVQDCEADNRFSKMKFIDKFKSSKVTLTNLATPINGTTNFSSSYITAGTYRKYANNNSMLLTGATDKTEVTATSSYTPYFNPDHTYYGAVEVLQETKQGGVDLYWPIAEPRIITGLAAPAAVKNWGRVSGVRTAATFRNYNATNAAYTARNTSFRLDYNNSSTAGKMWYDGLMIIDLTEAFGEGNEPTKAWCDANIPYFTGTKEFDFPNSGYGKYEFMLTYPRLNDIYTEVDYLASSGTQFIDTGVVVNQNSKIIITASHTGPYSIYGATSATMNYTAGGTPMTGYFYYAGAMSARADYSGSPHVFEQNKNTCYIDGNLYHTYSASTFTASCNLFLFARNNGSGAINDAGGIVKIYSCQIYDNGTLIRDFVPCKDKNGIPSMFDKVNKVFYYNKGSGSFATGSVKKVVPLDYYNRWTQTGSPNNSAPTGYQRLRTDWPSHAGPLRKVNGTGIYNCDNAGSSTWYAPIGQIARWTDTQAIPGADGEAQTETELWVRIDNIAGLTGTPGVYKKDNILMSGFYET